MRQQRHDLALAADGPIQTLSFWSDDGGGGGGSSLGASCFSECGTWTMWRRLMRVVAESAGLLELPSNKALVVEFVHCSSG